MNSDREKMDINLHNARLIISAGFSRQIPSLLMPHVAFLGRSNVGKSSMLNRLLGRKAFARVSATPGKTATINFYNIDDKILFVDLPGYGYAGVSKERKKSWGMLIEDYLYTKVEKRLFVLLLDSRHDPSSDDRLMLDWLLESGEDFFLVATKIDKLSKTQAATLEERMAPFYRGSETVKLIPFSSKTGQGREEILNEITERVVNR